MKDPPLTPELTAELTTDMSAAPEIAMLAEAARLGLAVIRQQIARLSLVPLVLCRIGG